MFWIKCSLTENLSCAVILSEAKDPYLHRTLNRLAYSNAEGMHFINLPQMTREKSFDSAEVSHARSPGYPQDDSG